MLCTNLHSGRSLLHSDLGTKLTAKWATSTSTQVSTEDCIKRLLCLKMPWSLILRPCTKLNIWILSKAPNPHKTGEELPMNISWQVQPAGQNSLLCPLKQTISAQATNLQWQNFAVCEWRHLINHSWGKLHDLPIWSIDRPATVIMIQAAHHGCQLEGSETHPCPLQTTDSLLLVIWVLCTWCSTTCSYDGETNYTRDWMSRMNKPVMLSWLILRTNFVQQNSLHLGDLYHCAALIR